MRHLAAAISVTILIALVYTGSVTGQEGPGGSGMPRSVNIDLVRVRALEGPEISRWSRTIRVEDRFYVAPLRRGGVAAYSKDGTKLWIVEQKHISDSWNIDLDQVGNRVVVFDPESGLASIIGPDGTVVRVIQALHASSYRLLPDGRIAATYNSRSPDRIGLPLHIQSVAGGVTSFGSGDGAILAGGNPWDLEWKIVRDTGENIWTHYRDRFLIEEWTAAGSRTGRRLVAAPEWLSASRSDIPRPFLHAALRHDNQILTIGHAQVLESEPLGVNPTLEAFDRVQDTVVEAWDLNSGEVIASRRVDPLLFGFADETHVFGVEGSEEGYRLVVWEVRLVN